MVLVNFILHLNITPKSFLYGFLYLKNLPVNGINDHWTEHLWSVSIEAQFYLFVPLLMFININKATIIAGMAVIGILVFALLGYNHAGVFYSNAALYHFCRVMMDAFWEGPFAILIGCLFSVLAFKGVINVSKAANRGALSCILFIAAIIIRSKTFYFYTPYLSEFVFDVLIGFVIVMSLNADNLFARLLTTRFLAWMGTLSYSIYIWQQIFVWIPYRVTGNTLFILSDVLRLTAMMGAACLSYYFFERRFLKMKSHFAEPGIRSK
jgi:peptidoglycan/LPS O-acetylase OafA/YrhL